MDDTVVVLNATDDDTGELYGTVNIEIISNDDDIPFSVSDDHELIVNGSLERGKNYSFIVVAKDGGELTSEPLQVTVIVFEVNRRAPFFNVATYSFSVAENVLFTGPVVLQATDPDNNQVEYFTDSTDGFISFNSIGIVSHIKAFDYEITQEIQINIYVTDGEFTSTPAILTITVIPENEFRPEFSTNRIEVTVNESINRFSLSVPFLVTDNDLDFTSEIGQGTIRRVFITQDIPHFMVQDTLNNSFFVLTNNLTFDYESGDRQFIVSIQAIDGGGFSASQLLQIVVNIEDVNDNSPEFNQSTYSQGVLENYQGDVLSVFATDNDVSPQYNEIQYTLQDNDALPFSIDSNGTISLVRELDYENDRRVFNITVQASDPFNQSDYALVLVQVMDVNEHSPVFSNPSYELSISESTSVQTTIFTLNASDADGSVQLGGMIHYSLQTTNDFYNVTSNGSVLVIAELDYEDPAQRITVLRIEANDGSGMASQTTITINLIDENEFCPSFRDRVVQVAVKEETYPIQLSGLPENALLQFVVTDQDTTNSSGYALEILENTTTFFLTPDGYLMLLEALDYETVTSYSLTIILKDEELNCTENSTVVINVTNTNDNRPFFENETYEVIIEENNVPSDPILNIQVGDLDGNITSFTFFAINSSLLTILSNGTVFLISPLDFETEREIVILVIVSDGKFNSTSTANITILVRNVNDEPPVFLQSQLNVHLEENVKPGDFRLEIQIEDKDLETAERPNNSQRIDFFGSRDSGIQSSFNYDLLGDRDAFEIVHNRLNGNPVIVNKHEFDYENKTMKRHFLLRLVASDGVHQSEPLQINVTIVDKNDNPPIFNQNLYHFNITENSQFKFVLYAIDGDESPEYSHVTYEILDDGDYDDLPFALHSNGTIVPKGTLDYEKGINEFIVTVKAFDIDNLNDTILLKISLFDANDHYPQFDGPHVLTIPEDATIGSVVGTFTASDDDLSPLLVILSSLTKLGHDVLVVLTRPPSLIAIVSLNSGSNSSF
ncbi:MAG: cadherin repeat domain-containing protein [Rhodobacteraceae bacterium]|nr:cadherin repeat domain-containing protein [Paracoccaceae bacterium]